jgi:serine-threonine kinase receptor-associated protein
MTQVKSVSTKVPISSVELSLDGKHITSAVGKEVLFWDVNTFELLKSYALPVELNSASLAPDASQFVVGGTSDFWVRVYDFNSCKEVGRRHYYFGLIF